MDRSHIHLEGKVGCAWSQTTNLPLILQMIPTSISARLKSWVGPSPHPIHPSSFIRLFHFQLWNCLGICGRLEPLYKYVVHVFYAATHNIIINVYIYLPSQACTPSSSKLRHSIVTMPRLIQHVSNSNAIRLFNLYGLRLKFWSTYVPDYPNFRQWKSP